MNFGRVLEESMKVRLTIFMQLLSHDVLGDRGCYRQSLEKLKSLGWFQRTLGVSKKPTLNLLG